ncbi:MAG: 3,4-dehydroadipyl-CoA semialdehyde dehydrogenase [Polyangia bacterium]
MLLRSFVAHELIAPSGATTPLLNPATEEIVAETGTSGVDFGAALRFAREVGGPALRSMNFASRGQLLVECSRALFVQRDELIGLAMRNGGNTRGDAKFDVDGAIGTLSAYGELGQRLGAANTLRDGDGEQPTRSAKLWGEHLWFPRTGVAVHINAFNFPAWGLAEKAAVAWLCGLPVISKPATSTAVVAARMVEILAGAQLLPRGALTFLPGSVGDLLDRLEGQDVLAFTGSSDTAQMLRRHAAVVERGVRLNIEADSLNAAVLGPDADSGEAYDLFIADVVRDITQKTGQKCTAIRRIFVAEAQLDQVLAELADRLGGVRVGNPQDEAVTMGPVATQAQLRSVRAGIQQLAAAPGSQVLLGGADPIDGIGAPAGKGFFVRPTLLCCRAPAASHPVHQLEVFGPVATVIPYRDSAELVQAAAAGGGGLVASIYSDDRRFVPEVVAGLGPHHGRLFLGSARLSGQSPGPGTVLPLLNHGGPGRAGDGHELGGVRGMQLYMQRCAIAGYRPTVEGLVPGSAIASAGKPAAAK